MSTSTFVAIIDYGLGNHRSVHNALSLLNVRSEITSDPQSISSATHLILPGVGSFKEGMEGLQAKGLVELLEKEVLQKKKNILGICLGMQLLASEGFEHGNTNGLGFIPGKVINLETKDFGYRLPHIGWNDVHLSGDHVITRGFDHDPIFYFVHSYHLVPEQPDVIAGVCDYGIEFAAIVERENIFGAQFHPEKSHNDGILILKNFLSI